MRRLHFTKAAGAVPAISSDPLETSEKALMGPCNKGYLAVGRITERLGARSGVCLTGLLAVLAFVAVASPPPASSAPGASPGQLFGFGDNYYGELGTATNNGTGIPNPTPAPVILPGENGTVVQAAAGLEHTLALTSSGQLYAFGENGHGQLGVPTNSGFGTPNPEPARVTLPGASGAVVQVAAGQYHSLAVTSTGQLYSFGYNRYGQLGRLTNSGTPTPTPEPGPVTLPGASGPVVHVAAGASDGFAVTSSGQLYSFGANTFGELGNAKNLLTFTPNPEPGLVTLPGEIGPAIQVASGLDHTLVLTASGQLYSFGENVAGQLGYEQNSGTEEPNQVPEPVSLPGASGPVVQIAAGGLHSLALTASGQLYSFGYNRYGQLGRPANSGTSEPTPLPGLVALPGATGRVVQIAAGENSSLALTASGQLFSFGENTFGQLGIATSDSEPHPVPALVALPAGATADTVARGSTALHALAIVADLAVVGTPLPTGAVGSPYRAGVQAVGGAPPYDWTAAGLPPGLSIDTASGVISGIPTAAGSYTATLTVADSDGIEALAPFLIPISAPQTLAIEGPPTLLPTPTISSARESARRWREGSALARISRANSISARSKRPPIGARFSFSLNEQASVHFSFTRPVSGRKVGRECVAKTHANGRRKVCTLTVTAATLSFAGHAGANTVSFQGRISRSERLDPGYYTLIIVATDSAGARSAPASLSFTIVR